MDESADKDEATPPEGIPAILHSTYDGAPFDACVDCGGALLESGVPYAVEKVIRDHEVIFEYALCAPCTQNLIRQFSEESMRRILEYLKDDGPALLAGGAPDRCHRCGCTGPEYEREHTVTGLLFGRQLLMGVGTLCAACTEGIESVLSQKTREAHDDFVTRNFPGVPSHLDLPVPSLII